MNSFTRKLKYYGLDEKHYSFSDILLNAALVFIVFSCFSIGYLSLNGYWLFSMARNLSNDYSCPYSFLHVSILCAFVLSCYLGSHFLSKKLMADSRGNIWYLSLHLSVLGVVIISTFINVLLLMIISQYYSLDLLGFTKQMIVQFQWQYYFYLLIGFFSWICLMREKKPTIKSTPVETTSGKLGSAEYASKEYLYEKGMIPLYSKAMQGRGQMIGKLDKDTYITLDKNVHSLIVAPPRSGKAVSGSIPLILDSEYATWCWDMKGELFMSTWEECLRKKRMPIAFNPTGVLTQYGDFRPFVTFNFNPLKTKFLMDSITREKYLDNLVKGLTADIAAVTHEKHFIELAVPIIKVMLNDYLGTEKTLVDLYDELVNIDLKKLINRFTLMLEKTPNNRVLRNALGTLEDTTERELSGIRNTYKRALSFLANPIWTQCFSKDGFDFYDYAIEQRDLFVIIDQSSVESYPKVVRFIFGLLKSTFDLLPQDAMIKNRYPVVLDEIAQVGPIEEIERIYELFGDKGVTLHLYFQNVDQIEKFKKSELIKGFSLKQFFCVRDAKTIEWIQKLVGKRTVLLNNSSNSKSSSISKKAGHFLSDGTNQSHSNSESISETGTELLHTDVIRELASDRQIVMYENLKPIICNRCFYFDDPRYENRSSNNLVFHRNKIDLDSIELAQKDFNILFSPYESKPLGGQPENNTRTDPIDENQKSVDCAEHEPQIEHMPQNSPLVMMRQPHEAPDKYIDYTLEEAVKIYMLGIEKGIKRKELIQQYRMSPYKYRIAKEEASKNT